MKGSENFMKENHMYLVTDGSALRQSDDSFVCSSAFIIKNLKSEVSKGLYLGKATNQLAELTAIHEGVTSLENFDFSGVDKLFIVSDSMYSIDCIKKWYPYNWSKSDKFNEEGIPFTKTGEPVKHYRLIESIYKRIKDLPVKVKILKIKSHMPKDSKKMDKAYKQFMEFNKYKLEYPDFLELVSLNEKCDQLAETYREENINESKGE